MVAAAVVSVLFAAALSVKPPSNQLCIIGAGPGGLQLGHLANQAGWNYRIFESAASAGSFFESYPVHRQLISLNKRHTGRADKEFNLRHDWNSLLDNEDTSPMTARTKARWPDAGILVDYLRDYAEPQEKAGKIKYNTTVLSIAKGKSPFAFSLQLKDGSSGSSSSAATQHDCLVLVTATGLSKPNVPVNVDGIEHTVGYESLPATGESFEGQSVAVLGLGNAAFETANEIGASAAFVHVWAARKPKIGPNGEDGHDFLSWESRYVGNLRAINAGFLDAYLLKSLDGGLGPLGNLVIRRCGAPDFNRRCIFEEGRPYRYKNGTGAKTVFLGFYEPNDPWAARFVKKVNSMGVEVHETGVLTNAGAEFKIGRSGVIGADGTPGLVTGELHQSARSLTVLASSVTEDIVDEMMEFATRNGDPHPLIFDKVIRCLGWKHQTNLYHKSATPLMQSNGKYPVMTSEYESVNNPGMYFAGQLGHGKDYKRSAGGFIHGFRYTTRFLFRVLQAKHYGKPWPDREVYTSVEAWDGESVGLEPTGCNPGDTIFECPEAAPSAPAADADGDGDGDSDGANGGGDDGGDGGGTPPSASTVTATRSRLMSANITESTPIAPTTKPKDFVGLVDKLITRINVASGPYQMVAVLGDGVVFQCPPDGALGDNVGRVKATYFEEMTVDYFNTAFEGHPRLFWSFGYGTQRKSLHESRRNGLSFQVHLWYYPGDCALPLNLQEAFMSASNVGSGSDARVKEVLRLRETVHTQWGTFRTRYRVAKWLHAKMKGLRHNDEFQDGWKHPDHEQQPQKSNDAATSLAAALEAGLNKKATKEKDAKHGKKNDGSKETKKNPDDADVSKYEEDGGNGQAATVHWKSAAEAASSWEAGHVDVTFVNMLGVPVILLHGSEAGWTKPAALPEQGAIYPKQSFVAKSHEREIWSAETEDGRHFGPWEIDISNGIVQDILIENVEEGGSSSGGSGAAAAKFFAHSNAGSADKSDASAGSAAGDGGNGDGDGSDSGSGEQDNEGGGGDGVDAAKAALKTNPCGSHAGCAQVLGDDALAQFLAFDSDKLLNLGITSAMDLLIFAHNGAGDGREGSYLDRSDYVTDFANPDGAAELQKVLGHISDLLLHLDSSARSTLLGALAKQATPALTAIVDGSDDAALIQLPLLDWVAQKHIPASAAVYFEMLQLKSVAEVAALSDEIVTDIAERLKFVEAWWFERGMAATKAAFEKQRDEL